MKKPPDTPEFARFTAAVRDIMKVSRSEMQERIEAHKQGGKRLPKGASLDPGVRAKLRSLVSD
jgi:hypothetical protein